MGVGSWITMKGLLWNLKVLDTKEANSSINQTSLTTLSNTYYKIWQIKATGTAKKKPKLSKQNK